MSDALKRRQEAGEEVENRMLDFLMGFEPAQELRVRDAKYIARYARSVAFDQFSNAAKVD